jgi:hypothetical protein
LFVNTGSSTLVGGSGSATLFGGGAGSQLAFFQGSGTGSATFVGGAGNSSLVAGAAGGLVAFSGAGGTVNLYGTSTSAFNYLVGGTGSETLNAAFSGGTGVLVGGAANALGYLSNTSQDAYFDGSGTSTLVGGTSLSGGSSTSLPDLLVFANGASGGTTTYYNWGANSGLVFIGYGATGDATIKSNIAAAGSGTSVSFTLSDNSKITLVGINGATINPSTNATFYS